MSQKPPKILKKLDIEYRKSREAILNMNYEKRYGTELVINTGEANSLKKLVKNKQKQGVLKKFVQPKKGTKKVDPIGEWFKPSYTKKKKKFKNKSSDFLPTGSIHWWR